MESLDSCDNLLQPRTISLALVAAVIVVALIGLAGWLTGNTLLASYGGQFIPMAPSTAICFLLLSVPLFSTLRLAQGPVVSHAALLAGGLVAFYALLVACVWLAGLPLSLEDLLLAEMGTLGKHPVGRMSPVTAFLFLLSGLSLIALTRELSGVKTTRFCLSVATLSGSAILLAGTVFSLGYTLGSPLLYESSTIPLALPTAISFLLLGGALTLAALLHSPVSGRWHRALNDLRIGIQLRLALGIILSFVLLLGVLTWEKTDLIWLQTQTIYDHPLQVRRAVGKLEVDIESISRHVRDLFLARNDQEIEAALQGIEIGKTDAAQRFVVLFDRYLGPREDLIALQKDFAMWNALRDETVRLFREGRTEEAEGRIRPGGVQYLQAEVVRDSTLTINNFARNKGDQLYRNATEQKDTLNRQLAVIVTAILLFSLVVSWLLLKGIRTPLHHLTVAAEQFRQGRLEARCRYVSANEFGVLSEAFNALAETVQIEMTFRERAALLNAGMLREIEARAFRLQVLEPLMQLTGSQVGAIYLLNGQKTHYELLESIGLNSARKGSFSATALEGEFGFALITRRMQRITTIPADTPFAFAAVSGDLLPREIITMPLLSGQEIPAIISLASLHGYDTIAVRLVTDMQASLSAWMSSMMANRRIEALTEGLDQQNRELQAQQEELTAANEELEEQTQRLQESEEKLKVQQEELEVTNQELAEKNDLLEQQNREVEHARNEIEKKAGEVALASKYKSEFLTNMSHELRTPLNSLLLLAQNLAQNRDGNLTGEQVEAARIIHGSGSDLLMLINDILDLSKIEAGRIDIQLGLVRISDLAEGMRDSFQHLADAKGIVLEIIAPGDAPTEISSDRKRLEQIIRNLISNAVKFTDRGGVTVTFGRPAPGTGLAVSGLAADDCLAVAVKDTGIGIAPELHKVIFEAFQQADGTTSRKYGGTGLGLSISRELATLLGGEIQLASEPGRGSTFTLYLPVAAGLRTQEPAPPSAGGAPRAEGSPEKQAITPRIADDRHNIEPSDRVMLVIEDDPDFARLLYEKCREKNFKCLAVPTGEEGLKLAAQYLPRAVILDLRLPGMDGWAVLSALKENTRTRHIPVHIVSVEKPSTWSLHKGAVGHIGKPANQQELEEAFSRLEKVLTGKPKRLLVVEDNPEIRRETVKLIGNGDVKVDEAENGQQALEALRSGGYDCVVLDLGLPDMDGCELLDRLHNEGVTLPPVIVYTARDLTLDEESALRERAESIVIKDVRSQERLLDEVSLFLHRIVSGMSDKKRQVIQNLHEADTLLRDKKVLVVDDDMRTTFAVSRLLAEYGMKPLKAANGEKALHLLAEQPDVDLVLMDIMMPVMDGYETMRRIRAQERFRNLPIIAFTAKAMPEDREKCLAAGANDYLPKPLDQGRLFSMLRVWLCR
ncbi:MAG: response regulator [Deltaproteobacteria bacterium]|nr:response regulator [Deltaproteobacteria bacterium]